MGEGHRAAVADKPARQKNDGDPRKHHYVPVFYQKNFVNAEGLLWVYDRNRRTYKELHPNVICVEKDLYSITTDDGPRDTRAESKVLWMVDSLGARGIHEFRAGKATHESMEQIAFCAAFQHMRSPTVRRDVSATYARAIEELGRVAFANVERAEAVLNRYARDTGESVEVSAESMVEAIQGKHVKFVATEIPFLRNMMEQAQTLSQLMMNLDWEILIAASGTGFLICDSPFVIVPPKGSAEVGFLIPGAVKYFPLTRSLCLRLGQPGRMRRTRNIDKETVRTINQNTAANSERFIMGPDRVQVENIVSRSKSAGREEIPRLRLKPFNQMKTVHCLN